MHFCIIFLSIDTFLIITDTYFVNSQLLKFCTEKFQEFWSEELRTSNGIIEIWKLLVCILEAYFTIHGSFSGFKTFYGNELMLKILNEIWQNGKRIPFHAFKFHNEPLEVNFDPLLYCWRFWYAVMLSRVCIHTYLSRDITIHTYTDLFTR